MQTPLEIQEALIMRVLVQAEKQQEMLRPRLQPPQEIQQVEKRKIAR